MQNCSIHNWEQNLEMIDKYSLKIDGFNVSDEKFHKLIELHKDKLAGLQISQFCLSSPQFQISEESIEIIRKIHPTYFEKLSI